jgi:hypothetical protein
MPLLDHSRPPLRNRPTYKSLNAAWGTFLCNGLNQGGMPPGYRAYPESAVGIGLEADLATYEGSEQVSAGNGDGSVATAVWAPPRPPLVVPVDFSDLESIEVKVYDDDGGGRLVAAVELVSPATKDRPGHRTDFAVKCAAYLQQEVSVLVVDIVTGRRTNLHRPLAELLRLGEPAADAVTSDLYAVAYRVVRAGQRTQLEAWPTALAVGQPPKMPLWLRDDLAVPLDLDSSYLQACASLGLPA